MLCMPLIVIGQQLKMDPFDIAPPVLIEDLKKLRVEKPDLKPEELVEAANELLEKRGLPFNFLLDNNSCSIIEKAKSTESVRMKLQTVGADPTDLKVPPVTFSSSKTCPCSITLPVFEITDNDLIALMLGTNIKFQRPKVFRTFEVFLVDNNDPSIKKKRWNTPFYSEPLGVSYDGNVLYLALPDTELKDLSLAVFSEGVFQFATLAEAKSNGVAKKLADSLIRFDNRGVEQTIMVVNKCGG